LPQQLEAIADRTKTAQGRLYPEGNDRAVRIRNTDTGLSCIFDYRLCIGLRSSSGHFPAQASESERAAWVEIAVRLARVAFRQAVVLVANGPIIARGLVFVSHRRKGNLREALHRYPVISLGLFHHPLVEVLRVFVQLLHQAEKEPPHASLHFAPGLLSSTHLRGGVHHSIALAAGKVS
jgi:hypothetical protein